jgi:hypothetical protein
MCLAALSTTIMMMAYRPIRVTLIGPGAIDDGPERRAQDANECDFGLQVSLLGLI